jgi:hypothetical protein
MALPLIAAVASAFASIIAFIIKHPFVSKMMIFGMFITLLGLALIYLKSLVAPYILTSPLMVLGDYFGILDGIGIYLTILVSGFGVKQILAFVRS